MGYLFPGWGRKAPVEDALNRVSLGGWCEKAFAFDVRVVSGAFHFRQAAEAAAPGAAIDAAAIHAAVTMPSPQSAAT
jgi:hypothetical protein